MDGYSLGKDCHDVHFGMNQFYFLLKFKSMIKFTTANPYAFMFRSILIIYMYFTKQDLRQFDGLNY